MPTAFLRGVGKKTKNPTNWLTFSSAEPFTIGVNGSKKSWDGTLYYSTDTTTWSEWDATKIASAEHGEEQRIYISGSGNSKITIGISVVALYYWLELTGNEVSCSGNIESLLDYESVEKGEHPPMAKQCFAHLFQHCTCLVTAPELPATTLVDYCYMGMFRGCTSLTSAPQLPATTLAYACYIEMFEDCTALTTAPELLATTLVDNCYDYMFRGCTSLINAPELLATTLADYCYDGMFNGCTSLTHAPELPATTLKRGCYEGMFYGCTSLINAPELPATTLAEVCYHIMFQNCTSLASVPQLPATTLADDYGNVKNGCYEGMFYGCTSIKLSKTLSGEYHTAYRIPTSGTGTKANYSLRDMFKNTGGTFTGTPSINTTYYTANEVV